MTETLIRYELDITGINPDNLVTGELHDLTAREVRAVTTTYGPFYTAGLVVRDYSNGLTLVRGIHYQCVELLQDATLRYGKEICSVILIIDRQISPQVQIDYHVVGGHYIRDSSAIANLYQTVINDNRPIQWEYVLSKPVEYPPTLHRHLVEDLYGFEPVVSALERIRNAMTLSNVPAFEAVLDWVGRRVELADDSEIRKVVPVRKVLDHHSLLAILTDHRIISPFRFENIPVEIREGTSLMVTVTAQSPQAQATLYWAVIHDTTDNADFQSITGSVIVRNGIGYFNLYVMTNPESRIPENFCIGLKNHASDVNFIAISYNISIRVSMPTFTNITASLLFIAADYIYRNDESMDSTNMFLSYSAQRTLTLRYD